LEMFTGNYLWMSGSIIGKGCETYFGKSVIPIPESMKNLLRWCFSQNEADRPDDFGVIEAELLKIYQSETGRPYPRPEPKAASLTAGSLNNYALSYLDIGKPEEAEKYWQEAVKIDPNNATCQYNYGIHLWKTAQIDDMEALHRLMLIATKDEDYYYCLAKLHLARADAESAIECINESYTKFSATIKLGKISIKAREIMIDGVNGSCKCTFKGNTGSLAVCFSPDGMLALSGNHDHTVKIWDISDQNIRALTMQNMSSGQCKHTLSGHTAQISSVSFSPDGKQALSGSLDGTVKIWDVDTGECIRTNNNKVEGAFYSATRVSFSPDGNYALSANTNNTVLLWNITTGQCIHVMDGHRGVVYDVCFSADGKQALTGSGDRTMKLWDITTGQCTRIFTGHTREITSVCFSTNGQKALSGSLDNTVKVWDIKTGECIRTLKGHPLSVISVCFSPDGHRALSGSDDKTMKLWDIETGKCIRTFEKHLGSVVSVCFSPDNNQALSAGGDMKLWNIPCNNTEFDFLLSQIQTSEFVVRESELFHNAVTEINRLINQKEILPALTKLNEFRKSKTFAFGKEFFECNRKIASYCVYHQLNSYALKNSLDDIGVVFDFILTNKSSRMILGGDDKTIKIWDIESGKCIRTLEGHTDNVITGCFSQDGKQAISGSDDKTIKVWDIETGKCIRTLEGHTAHVLSVCFSPDGKLALSKSPDLTVKIWDIEKNNCIFTLHFQYHFYHSICFSPDSKYVLSTENFFGKKEDNNIINLLNIADGKISKLKGHSNDITSACFSPDSQLALSGCDDGIIKLWNVTTGKCIRTLKGHSAPVLFVCFTPDGKSALSCSIDNTMKIWDISWGECLFDVTERKNSTHTVCFSPNGRLALVGGEGKDQMNMSGFNVDLFDFKTGRCILSLEDNAKELVKFCFSPDGQTIVISTKQKVYIYDLDFNLEFPGWHDWNEGALPYLKIFLTIHPNWTEDDFNNILIPDLQNRGYGWLQPEGVRAKLKEGSSIRMNSELSGSKGAPAPVAFSCGLCLLFFPLLIFGIFSLFGLVVNVIWKAVFSIFGLLWAWGLVFIAFRMNMLRFDNNTRPYQVLNFWCKQWFLLFIPALGLFVMWFFDWFPMKTWAIWLFGIYGLYWLIETVKILFPRKR